MPVDLSKMNDAFNKAVPELLIMEAGTLQRPRVGRERANQLTAILKSEFKPLTPLLAAELSPERHAERLADLEAVEPNALIFYAADLAVETPWTSEQKARRADLIDKAHKHDETLMEWAVPLFRKKPNLRGEIDDIVRGRGIRDDAEDTVRWVALFRKEWAFAEGKTPVTLEMLDQAETDATDLLRLLDAVAEDDSYASPRDIRRRAYTRWAESYLEVFHLGRYLLRADPEAAARIPSISAERAEAAAGPQKPAEPQKPADPKPA